jgi:exosome complex component RRP42
MERLGAISGPERAYIEEGVSHGVRMDGRGCLDRRGLELFLDAVPGSFGSARVRSGGSEALACVRCDRISGAGIVRVRVECWSAAVLAGLRQRREVESELSACLSQLYGRKAVLGWEVQVDAVVLSADGSVLDVLSCAVYAALSSARVPRVLAVGEQGDWQVSPYAEDMDPLYRDNDLPIWISQGRIGSAFVVDACLEEERCSSAGLLVAVTREGKVSGFLQTGSGTISHSALMDRIAQAKLLAQTLFQQLLLI